MAAPTAHTHTPMFQEVLAEELQDHPEQSGRSAVARTARKLGQGRAAVAGRTGVLLGRRFWAAAPAGRERRDHTAHGGAKRSRPELTGRVEHFLLKRGRETRHLCRTKPKHRKVADVCSKVGKKLAAACSPTTALTTALSILARVIDLAGGRFRNLSWVESITRSITNR